MSTPLNAEARFGGDDRALTATLRQPAGIGTLRYTTDGSAPSPTSPAYDEPLTLSPGDAADARRPSLGDGAARRCRSAG